MSEIQTLPPFDLLRSELEAFELFIVGYVGSMLRAIEAMPEDKWNWSISVRTPSPRELCEHTYMRLACDRQQMTEPDYSKHKPVADLPANRSEMIALLRKEAIIWQQLVRGLKPEDLNNELLAWTDCPRTIRSFLFHMAQNVVYKAGQAWTLHFELGLDGEDRYTAPYPDQYYEFPEVKPWPSPRS